MKLQKTIALTGLLLLCPLGHGPSGTTANAETFPFNTAFTIFGESVDARFNLWLPNNTSHVRGLVLMVPGGDNDWRERAEDPEWQNAASAMGFGLVGIGCGIRMVFFRRAPRAIL